MPKVGTGKNTRHFPYTPEGYREAQEYARKTGQKLVVTRRARKRRARKGAPGG